MANSLDVILSTVADTLVANGTGASVDIGTRYAAKFSISSIRLTAGSIRVYIDTSIDETNWRPVHAENLGGTVVRSFLVGGLSKYIRLRWEISEGSYQLAVTGRAMDLYVTPADVRTFGMPVQSMDDVLDAKLLEFCVAATDEADGYIDGAFKLPLLAWGSDLTLKCAKMATRYFLDFRGWDPEGADATFMEGYTQATSWLTKVAKGLIKPAGIVDSTPEVVDSGSYVSSRPRREAYR